MARTVVLFDGVCGLCNGFVDFLIPRDPGGRLVFGALQSDAGRRALREAGLPDTMPDNVVVVEDGRVFRESTGVLHVLARLPWPWRALGWLSVVPRPLRDAVYRFVAKHRYGWFGIRDTCRMPAAEDRERFLA